MLKAFEYRLCPNAKHRDAFAQHFGCVRKVYNLFLGEQKEAYEAEKTPWNFYEYKRKLPTIKQELDTQDSSQGTKNSRFVFRKTPKLILIKAWFLSPSSKLVSNASFTAGSKAL